MLSKYKLFVFINLISVLIAALTVSGYAAGSEPDLSSLDVSQTKLGSSSLFYGQTRQYKAIGTYSDGSVVDLTLKATWKVSDDTKAVISSSGLVTVVATASGHGSATSDSAGAVVYISASISGVSSEPVPLTVIGSGGSGAYYQSGGYASGSGLSIFADDINQSGIKITDEGVYVLSDSSVVTTGDSNIMGLSSAIGINAGVLTENGGKLVITDSIINTAGKGANGVFSHGEGSLVKMSNVMINTTGAGGHGVDVTYMGEIIIEDSYIHTFGPLGSATLSADTGDGLVTATRVRAVSEGNLSPGFYAIGQRSVFRIIDSELIAKISEGGLLTTGVNVIVTNSILKGNAAGVSIAQGSTLIVTGGTIEGTGGPGIVMEGGQGIGRHDIGKWDLSPLTGTTEGTVESVYVPAEGQAGGPSGGGPGGGMQGSGPPGGGPGEGMQGSGPPGGGSGGDMQGSGPPGGDTTGAGAPTASTSDINTATVKQGVKIIASTGNIVHVREGAKGVFMAEEEELTGNIFVDVEAGSSLDVILRNSTLTGKVQGASMTFESGSSWNVTEDSAITSLSNKGGISGNSVTNIIGNGHTVYYDKGVNKELGGKTYKLAKGGKLKPK